MIEVNVKGSPKLEVNFESKIVKIEGGGIVDSALSTESENPVMNKVLTARFNGIDTRIDSLPTKLSQFEDDVVAGKYLPLSGGTVTGALGITTSTKPTGNIGFWSASDIGFIMAKSSLQFYKANTQEYFDLLHSGNVGEYALKYYGNRGAIDFNDVLYNGIQYVSSSSSNGGKKYGTLASFYVSDAAWQIVGGRKTATLLYRGGNGTNDSWEDWKTIAFTDSNVASATKLQNARTIWGQSFDGTGNVSGNIRGGKANFTIYGYNSTSASDVNILTHDNNKSLWLGYGMNAEGNATIIAGTSIEFRYGTSRGFAALINTSGNVTIGSSDLAGTNYKLYVDGAINTTGTIYLCGGYLSLRPATKVYGDIEMTSSIMRFQAIHDGVAFLPIALNPNGGYVGIGTTSPAYKLDVSGDAHISGNLIVDGTITPSTASASYSLRGGTSNKTVVIIEVGSTEETIEHGLGADVAVSLYAKDTTKEDSWVLTSNGDIEITDTAVIVTFDNPTLAEHKVVIVG